MPEPIAWTGSQIEAFDAWRRAAWDDYARRQKAKGSTPSEAEFERDVAAPARTAFGRKLFAKRFDASGASVTSDDRAAILGERLVATVALEAVRGLLAAHRRNPSGPNMLVLLGGTGTGKTVAASWALYELGGSYVVPNQLYDRLRPGKDREHMAPVEGRVVVLDDLGTEQDTRFPAALFQLVNDRQRHGLLTILTGNLTREQLRERYDARVIERLNHCGRVAELGGDSLRSKAGGM